MTPTALHVAHNLGSGVEAAITDYAQSTPHFLHHLLYSSDPSCEIDRSRAGEFVSETLAAPQLGAFARALRRTVHRLDPDLIHAHSSIAGVLCRAALHPRRVPVVYTPHCFGFERRDVRPLARAAFWSAEAALAHRAVRIVACSPREAQLARRLPGGSGTAYVPNVVRAPADLAARVPGGPVRVVSCGRLAPQKNPALFADVAREARTALPDAQFEWIGGGDDALAARLRDSGVTVTGWLPRRAALDRIARADVYVHTASWESAPLSILEAAAVDVPVLARATPAIRLLGCEPLWSTVAELVDMLRDEQVIAHARQSGRRLRARHTVQAQQAALTAVYDSVTLPSRYPSPGRRATLATRHQDVQPCDF